MGHNRIRRLPKEMTTKERLNYAKAAPEVFKTMFGVHEDLERSGLDKKLMDLVYLKGPASQPVCILYRYAFEGPAGYGCQ